MAEKQPLSEANAWIKEAYRSKMCPEYGLFLISLIIGASIRLYLAFTAPINMDENFYAFDGHLLESGLTPFQDYPTRSPLMIIISAFILRMGGDFFTLRITAVLFSIATGILIFYAGKILGGKMVGAFASTLFFLSPYSIRYGYFFFTQPFEAFLVGLSFTLVIRWIADEYGYSGKGQSETPWKEQRGAHVNEQSITQAKAEKAGSFRQYWPLILSGIVLGSSVFIRRSSFAFFPAGILILVFYHYSNTHKNTTDSSFWKKVDLQSLGAFVGGFLFVLIPGLLLFMKVSGLSYTTYFFYSDYIQAHSSIVGNLSFSLLYFDTRAYYFLSIGMFFITLILLKLPNWLFTTFNWNDRMGDRIRGRMTLAIRVGLFIGWSISFFTFMVNNYLDTNGGLLQGILILLLFILTAKFIRQDHPDTSKGHPFGRTVPLFMFTTFASFLLLISAEEGYHFSFIAIIILNIGTIAILIIRDAQRTFEFNHPSENGFPAPLIPTGIFLLCILLFYLLFRVILPYYYDLLFPISIITAFLIQRFIRSIDLRRNDIIDLAKVAFICTLILSVPVSMMTFVYDDTKANETEIEDFIECVDYLKEFADPGEEIFSAKAVIPLQAGLENIFNLVRPASYLNEDTDLIERMDYPTIPEIIDYLENNSIRFIVVDWVMQTYFRDIYPDYDGYLIENYHKVKSIGPISILMRNEK